MRIKKKQTYPHKLIQRGETQSTTTSSLMKTCTGLSSYIDVSQLFVVHIYRTLNAVYIHYQLWTNLYPNLSKPAFRDIRSQQHHTVGEIIPTGIQQVPK